MPKFISYDYNQSSMVVINYQDQLQPGTLEHAIHHLINNKIDLSVFQKPRGSGLAFSFQETQVRENHDGLSLSH